jgi:hypothetical protein
VDGAQADELQLHPGRRLLLLIFLASPSAAAYKYAPAAARILSARTFFFATSSPASSRSNPTSVRALSIDYRSLIAVALSCTSCFLLVVLMLVRSMRKQVLV